MRKIWNASTWKPNSFTVISGSWYTGKTTLINHIFLKNFEKVDYTVIVKFDLKNKEHKYIEPKIQIPFNLPRLQKLITFQQKNKNKYRLLLIFESSSLTRLIQYNRLEYYKIWINKLFASHKRFGISIILNCGSFLDIPPNIRMWAEYLFVSMSNHTYKREINHIYSMWEQYLFEKIIKKHTDKREVNPMIYQVQQSHKYILEQALLIRDKVYIENGTVRFSFLLCHPSERLIWTNPDFRNDYPKPKFLLPCIYNFLTQNTIDKPDLPGDELEKNYLKELVNNYLNFRASRLYARLLILHKPTTKCPKMAQLQSFFQLNPGLLKLIGTKLLLFGFHHH